MSNNNFEDDLDFDDEFGDLDFDPFSEPPIPKGRSPITHSLIKTGNKFIESFTDDKMETARKYADASIPSAISSESNDIKSIIDGAHEGFNQATKEIKEEAKPFLDAVEKVIPKGGALESMVNFAREKLGFNDLQPTSEQLANDSASKAALAVSEIMGEQRSKEEFSTIVRDNIRAKRELSGLEIQATTASNLEFINKFNQEVVSRYQRKSLELQYRHLYTADEQLAVTKAAFDGFKNQLESIVINTALPELTKMHNSEFVKQKLYSKLTDGLFSSEGVVGAIKSKFSSEIRNIGSDVAGGMRAVTDGLEQYDSFKEMSHMLGGGEGLIAQILADGLINTVGKRTGNLISKTKIGTKAVDYVRNLMLDPSEQLRKDAEGRKDGWVKDFLNTASDFTRVSDGERTYSIDNNNTRDPAVFNNLTQTSITKIIPGYLAKILASVDAIRTGTEQEELRYDTDTGIFETTSKMRNNIKNKINKDVLNSGVHNTLINFINDLSKTSPVKFTKAEEADFREGLLRFAYSGKSLHPNMLEENGFYTYFPKKSGLKLKIAIGRYIRKDPANKRNMREYLARIKENAPDPMSTLNSYNDTGNMDLLKDTGLVEYNEKTKSYVLKNEEYKQTLGKAIRVEEENKEEKKPEKIFKSKFAESMFNRYQENLKNKEPVEEKEKSNWSKAWSKFGDWFVEKADNAYDHGIDGYKEDFNNFKEKASNTYDNINTIDDLTKAIKETKMFKTSADAVNNMSKLNKVINDTIKKSDNPEMFFSNLKETEEYKTISTSVKEELEELYGKGIKVKDAVVEDIKNTDTAKTANNVYKKVETLGLKTYNVLKTAIEPVLEKAKKEIFKNINNLSKNNKIRMSEILLPNTKVIYEKLDNLILENESKNDTKYNKEIKKISNDLKKNYDKLHNYNYAGRAKYSLVVEPLIDNILEASKYIESSFIKKFLSKVVKVANETTEEFIGEINNSMSRSNENNIVNKAKKVKEKITEVATEIKDNTIGKLNTEAKIPDVNNGLAKVSKANIMSTPEDSKTETKVKNTKVKVTKKDSSVVTDRIVKSLTSNIMDKDVALIKTKSINMKLLNKVKFMINPEWENENDTKEFKQLLIDHNVNDKILNMLCSFKVVIVGSGQPGVAGAYVSDLPQLGLTDVLMINTDIINKNMPNMSVELYNIIAHEFKHKTQHDNGSLIIPSDVSNWYESKFVWKGKEYLGAEYFVPFAKYPNSPWEKEAYKTGVEAMYDRLVDTNELDVENTPKKPWVTDIYNKTINGVKETIKEVLPAKKQEFEKAGIPWYYDNNGKLIKNKITKTTTDLKANIAKVKPKKDITEIITEKDAKITKPENKKDTSVNNTDANVSGNKFSFKNIKKIFSKKEKTNEEPKGLKGVTENMLKTVKDTVMMSKEEMLDSVTDKAFNKLSKDIKKASTEEGKRVKVMDFIYQMTKILNVVDKVTANSENNAMFKEKIKTIRAKLKELSKMDLEDISKLNKKVNDIKEEIAATVEKAHPEEEMLSTNKDEFKKKDVKTAEDTFLDILNSDDPVGAMKAKIKDTMKGILKKGVKGAFNIGKKIVLADIERGKKLRAFLKEKLLSGEPGMIRTGLNTGLNKVGRVLSKITGKTVKGTKDAVVSDKENGDKLRNGIFNLFKKKDKEPKKKKNILDGIQVLGAVSKNRDDKDKPLKGSWESIIKKREDEKANANKNSMVKTIKEQASSPLGISTIIAGGLLAMKAMGITLEDISGFVKGAWGTLKTVGSILGGIWDTLKTVGGWIKDSFGFIKKGLSKIPVVGDMFKDKYAGMTKEEADESKMRLAELEAKGDTSSDEYKELKSKVSNYDSELATDQAESKGNTAGQVAGAVAAGYIGKKVYNVGSKVVGVSKAVTGLVKGKNVETKLAGKVTEGAVKNSKVLEILKSFKGKIAKKFGEKAGKTLLAKLASKIAARIVPIAGLALLAYDISKITYDMVSNGTDLKSAISKQILGFDLFDDNDLPKDENGNLIKPDESTLQTESEEDTGIIKATNKTLDERIQEVDKNSDITSGAMEPIVKTNNNNLPVNKKENDSDDKEEDGKKGFFSNVWDKVKEKTSNVKNKITTTLSKGWEKVKDFVSKGIGSVAAYFESGKAGAGTISSGNGDLGGKSYGSHQLASKTGTLGRYVSGSKYKNEFAGLQLASPEFDAKWKEIYSRDPEGFAEDQESFITSTHYVPLANKLKSNGLDLNTRSDALKSAVYSVGVQFGPGSSLVNKALDSNNVDSKTADDESIIKSIYGYKKENNDVLFKSSSAAVRQGTLNRAFREEAMVMDLLSKEGNKGPTDVAKNVSDKVSTGNEAANNVLYKTDKTNDSTTTNTPNTNTVDTSKSISNTAPTTNSASAPVSTPSSNISTSVSNNISAPVSAPVASTTSSVDAGTVAAISETNKNMVTMNSTLSASLEVQKQMLDALNALNKNLGDRQLNLSKEDKNMIEATDNSVTNAASNIVQEVSKPNVNLARKKYA